MPLNPPLRDAPRYPLTSLVAIAAIVISVRWWTGHGLAGLALTPGSLLTQPWTLISSILPHVNVVHLFFNLSWWWLLGTRLERAWGAPRMIGVVVLLAAVSSAAEYALGAAGVGLSGVVYGFATLLWVVQNRYPALQGTVTRQTLRLFAAWFVVCIVLTVTKIMPIGNAAHGAGALCGWLLGKCIIAEPRGRPAWFGALLGMLLIVGAGATVNGPWSNLSRFMESNSRNGYLALKEARYDDAVRFLEAARKESPDDAGTLSNLGSAYLGKDRQADALAAYQRAVEIDPSHKARLAPTIANLLDQQIASAAERKDLPAVKSLAEESLRWNPSGDYAKKLLEWVQEAEVEEKPKNGG